MVSFFINKVTCTYRLIQQLLCVICLLTITCPFVYAQGIDKERLESAALIKFSHHITWPDEAKLSEFSIGVYRGKKTFVKKLTALSKKTTIKGLTVTVENLTTSDFDPHRFQLIYIPNYRSQYVVDIASYTRRTETLIVANESREVSDFMLNMLTDQSGNLSFEMNRSNIIFEHLGVDNDIFILGGSELDVAELFRMNEENLNQLKEELFESQKNLDERRKEIEKKNKRLSIISNELSKKNDKLKRSQLSLQANQNKLQASLERISLEERKLNDLSQKLLAYEDEIDIKKRKIDSLSVVIDEINQAVDQQRKDIEDKETLIVEQREWLVLLILIASAFLVLMLIIWFIDLSRKRLNKKLEATLVELSAMKDEADAANNAKSLFLAKMSHEIRTPMSGVLGMADLLSDLNLNEEQKNCNDVIRSSGQALLTVINDILDYSKIEAGKMELESISFDLEECIKDVLKIFRLQSSKKKIPIISDISEDIPKRLMGDPLRIRQILINLINNAFKFTETGQLIISVRLIPDEQDMFKLSVIDSGIGLNEKQKAALFGAFSQADSSVTRKYGGTGLGLAISKQLSELMGGGIGVDSVEGEGSTFWVKVKLPIDNDRTDKQPLSDSRIIDKSILIIDNNLVTQEILVNQACSLKLITQTVSDLDACERLLEQRERELSKYDFILCCLKSSDMDMVRFYNRLKERSLLGDSRFILSSLETIAPDNTQLLNAPKTIAVSAILTRSELEKTLLKSLSCDSDETMVKAVVLPDDNVKTLEKSLNILVADDNPVNRSVIKGVLKKKFSQDVVLAGDGVEAVELVTKSGERFDIVFMDCEMPNMDGFTATQAIRAWEQATNAQPTPVVALTAHVLEEHRQRCIEAGMDDFLVKPIQVDQVGKILSDLTKC